MPTNDSDRAKAKAKARPPACPLSPPTHRLFTLQPIRRGVTSAAPNSQPTFAIWSDSGYSATDGGYGQCYTKNGSDNQNNLCEYETATAAPENERVASSSTDGDGMDRFS
mmetsp:Transcript_24836/g.30518  ORF Transcript_24836/g.30518 Transcript_24836/m.30518 type:complete len:110 (+) Transcript_24836:732-1061(+)